MGAVFRKSDSSPGLVILKMGVMDDPQWPNENVPKGELFVEHRVGWVEELEGAVQNKAMGG